MWHGSSIAGERYTTEDMLCHYGASMSKQHVALLMIA